MTFLIIMICGLIGVLSVPVTQAVAEHYQLEGDIWLLHDAPEALQKRAVWVMCGVVWLLSLDLGALDYIAAWLGW